MAYTNSQLGDFMDALKPTAEAWEADIDAGKAEIGTLFKAFLDECESYYRSGGDRPPIPPRTL